MVFSAFYLIMIRYRIANICLTVLRFVWIIAILVNNAFKTAQRYCSHTTIPRGVLA